jgi:hypothetical protein
MVCDHPCVLYGHDGAEESYLNVSSEGVVWEFREKW